MQSLAKDKTNIFIFFFLFVPEIHLVYSILLEFLLKRFLFALGCCQLLGIKGTKLKNKNLDIFVLVVVSGQRGLTMRFVPLCTPAV